LSYAKIIEYARGHSESIIEEMKTKEALQFMTVISREGAKTSELVNDLQIEAKALDRTKEILEEVLQKMEKG